FYRVPLDQKQKPYLIESLDFKGIELPSIEYLHKQTATEAVELPISKHLRWLKETDNKIIAESLVILGGEELINSGTRIFLPDFP
ncbi:MAG: hypothetical protein ABL857_07005, partial [Rickettsiales bacterium]